MKNRAVLVFGGIALIITILSSIPKPAFQKSVNAEAVTYSGKHARWVSTLLDRSGEWRCPSTMTSRDGKPPQVKAESCTRDQYVAAAVVHAWAAECYYRAERNSQAEGQAENMREQLQNAEDMCGDSSSSGGSCDTSTIYRCGELD